MRKLITCVLAESKASWDGTPERLVKWVTGNGAVKWVLGFRSSSWHFEELEQITPPL